MQHDTQAQDARLPGWRRLLGANAGSRPGRRRRGLATLGLLGLLLVPLAAIGPAPVAMAAGDPTVTIANFAFQPATLTVTAGDTVTWNNTDAVSHTSTSDTGVWDSKPIPSGGTFSFRFDTPGTFTYHCAIHPQMHGTIVVLAAGQEPTATDGRRLSGESPATQALFRAVWGDQAAAEWVKEHNAAIGSQMMATGSEAPATAPSAMPAMPVQPSMAPAPAAPTPAPMSPAPMAPAPARSGPSGY